MNYTRAITVTKKRSSHQPIVRSTRLHIPLDEGGEVMHVGATRHVGQHVAEEGKKGVGVGLIPRDITSTSRRAKSCSRASLQAARLTL